MPVLQGRPLSGNAPSPKRAVRLSHYLFLGRGDYLLSDVPLDRIDPKWRRAAEVSADPADWSFSWNLDAWRRKLDALKRLGSERLYLVMNGFELPYPSRKHPQLVEPDHVNVTHEFLQSALDHAARIGLEVVAGFSTTGHCDRALQVYPDLAGVHADGQRWKCAMCHNHPQAQLFVFDVLNEVLDRYQGFSGVFLHPPEVDEYCHCIHCAKTYRSATGRDLAKQDEAGRMSWFWQTGVTFLSSLYDRVRARNAHLDLYSCTIPGVWRRHFDAIAPLLPPDVKLIHWRYGRFDDAARNQLGSDLRMFTAHGHRVSFANSVIFDCSSMTDAELRENNRAVNRFVQGFGVDEIVYFVGPVWKQERIAAGSVRPE
jgi:hypothetical protein